MNDLDALADRLDQLGRRAPVPVVEPLSDIRRGRLALRRRRARTAAGAATALMAVGAVVATTPHLPLSGRGSETAIASTESPSAPAKEGKTATYASDLCGAPVGSTISAKGKNITVVGPDGVAMSTGPAVPSRPAWKDPVVAPTLAAYLEAASTLLDPSHQHLDRTISDVQGGCGSQGPVELGTELGWRDGQALGVVAIDVSSPANDQAPQVVINHHDRWRPYDGPLPVGAVKAQVADDSEDGGGHLVLVERTDGLTVAIAAAGVWGNNAAPGSPAVTDLPKVDALVRLAASPALTLPRG